MAIGTKTFTLGVNDCKVFPITTDTVTAYEVGTGIDVPTVKSVKFDFEVDEKELYGDEEVRDIYSKCKKVTWSVEYGEMALDLQAAIMGGATVASGVTPNQKNRFGYTLGVNDNYFQLAFKTDYTDELGSTVDDMHVYIMKCKINANSFEGSAEEYGTLSFGGTGINTNNVLSAGRALYIDVNETAAALTAIESA